MVLGAAQDAEWRGRPKSLSWFVRWIALSLALHLPLTPLLGLLGFVLALDPRDTGGPPPPPITEIPLEILPQTEAPAPPPEPAAEPAAVALPEAVQPKPRRKPKPEALDAGLPVDAGTDAESDAGQDGGAPDAAIADARDAGARATDAGLADAAVDAGTDAGKAEAQPLAVAGARGVVDPNANVRVLIDTQRLRSHPLGPRIGKLLGQVHQWRDFFGPTGIDPVRDIDRILIVGPQLRDSSAVVALIQHRIPRAKLRAALDALVSRDPSGEWLDGGAPVAKARADRADRYFVTPSSTMLVVTPESSLKSARRMGPQMRLPLIPAPEVVTVHVETPWRVFIGSPIGVPRSLRWADVHVAPDPGGGAVVRLVAQDEDEATARTHAARMGRDISDGFDLLANASNIFGLLFGGKTKKLVDSIEFHSEGARIVGTLTFTEAQVVDIVDRVAPMLGGRSRRVPSSDAGGAPR